MLQNDPCSKAHRICLCVFNNEIDNVRYTSQDGCRPGFFNLCRAGFVRVLRFALSFQNYICYYTIVKFCKIKDNKSFSTMSFSAKTN